MSLAPDEQTGFAMTLLRMLAFRPGNAGAVAPSSAPPVNTARPANASAPAAAKAPPVARSAPASAAPATKPAGSPASAPAPAPSNTGLVERPDWHGLMRQLPVRGLVQQLAFQTELQDWNDSPAGVKATIVTPMPQLASESSVARLAEALTNHFGKTIKIVVEKGEVEGKTVAKVDAQIHQEKRINAEQLIAADPFIQIGRAHV